MPPVKSQRGFSIVEVVVGVAIMGFLLATAAPSFALWLKNSQVKTAAEAIQNGLQFARGEAVRRNRLILFQLTDSLDNTCSLSLDAGNWVVSAKPVAGKCAGDWINDTVALDILADPAILQVRPAMEGARTVVLAASQASVGFNALGRITPTPGTLPVAIEVTNPSGGACRADGGPVRCLRVTVTLGGQIRICDPDPALAATSDPQRCTASG